MAADETEVVSIVGKKSRTDSPSAERNEYIVEESGQFGSPALFVRLNGCDHFRRHGPVVKRRRDHAPSPFHWANEILQKTYSATIICIHAKLIRDDR